MAGATNQFARGLGWLCLLAALAACDQAPSALIVRLRTDYQPGRDFTEATVELIDSSDVTVELETVTIAPTVAALDGHRLTVFDGVSNGAYAVRVVLLDGSRQRAERRVELDLSGSQVVTVLVHRRCEGVLCPEVGDSPNATECFAGECVPPSCRPEDPISCGAGCSLDTDCPSSGCERGLCSDSVCFVVPDDSACDVGQICDLTEGCLDVASDAGPPDAGPPDAGPPDAGPPDAGPPDAGPPPPPLPDCPSNAHDCASGEIRSWERSGSWACRADGALGRTGGTLTCRVCNGVGCVDCPYNGVVLECQCRGNVCSSGICNDVNNGSSRCDDGTEFGCSNIVDAECPNG